jgi:hypothetical protein
MALPVVAEIGRLGADLADINPTIIQKEILEVAETYSRIHPLVTDMEFIGPGMTTNLPYMDEMTFASTAEGASGAYSEASVAEDTATVIKYTLDAPISMEAKAWGAGNIQQAIIDEGARAYAKKISQLITAHIHANASSTMDVDIGATLTMDHVFTASENLLALGLPEPYHLVLNPTHATDILSPGSSTLNTLAGLNYHQDFIKGANPLGYLGNLANFQVWVDPYATAASSTYFPTKGVNWVWKAAEIPGQKGRLVSEVSWERSMRSFILSMTFFGVPVLRHGDDADVEWAGRLYNAT